MSFFVKRLRLLRQSRWLPVVAAAFLIGAALGRQFGPYHAPLVEAIPSVGADTLPLGAPLNDATTGSSGTQFGSSVMPRSGETYGDAVQRVNQQFGGMDVMRVFYGGLPAAWPGKAGGFNGNLIVSFKDSPANILAGNDDTRLKSWFASAPRDRTIFWSYYHEPEDDIARGQFTAAQYRAAWDHVDALADQAGNPQLRSTLILMGFTLGKYSGRTWTDYYDAAHVDVLGWDCYNSKRDDGAYATPAETYGPAIAASKNAGKPWGIAETGSYTGPVVGSDAAMATWLQNDAEYLRSQGARFVSYFDSNPGEGPGWDQDWRIDGLSKSVAQWRYQVQQ